MSNIEILMLMAAGLWLYSRCSHLIHARHYEEYIDEDELHYSDQSVDADSKAA